MNILIAFAIGFFGTTYAMLILQVWRDKKTIALLEERVKIWGECAYALGYNDGVRKRKAQPKTFEQVIAEERENANQTVQTSNRPFQG